MATVVETVAAPAMIADRARIFLHDVPWDVYVSLSEGDENRHVRMAYHDGTLELMALEHIHEISISRLGVFVRTVTEMLDIPCSSSRMTTFRRAGGGAKKGSGKEADESFYLANEPSIRGKRKIDLTIDPPPDLAIEVDNTADSARKLSIYAVLGVPEVWRFDVVAGTLWFGSRQLDGTYVPIDRGLSLPMVTPALVLDALRLGEGMPESRWTRLLRDWVREHLAPPPEPDAGP